MEELLKSLPPITIPLIAILAGYIFKHLFTLFTFNLKRAKLRIDSIKLINEILQDNNWKNRSKRIIIEESFKNLYKKPLSFKEINILMHAENPSRAFPTYLNYRPNLEIDKSKTKFKFKTNKRPYWLIRNKKLPKSGIMGFIWYILLALPAEIGKELILTNLNITQGILFYYIWALYIMLYIFAIASFFTGLIYQDSEKNLLFAMPDKFNVLE